MFRRLMPSPRPLLLGVAVLAASLAGAGGFAGRSAEADHVPGAFYSGTHSAELGGAVSLTVSETGSAVISFNVTWFRNGCQFNSILPWTIENHSFRRAATVAGGVGDFEHAGTFKPGGVVEGTTAFTRGPNAPPVCNSTSFTWRATTTSTAATATPIAATPVPPAPAPSVALAVTPNSPYAPGSNSVVVQGRSPIAAVATRIATDSGRPVQAIWVLAGGRWLYYLPALPTLDGGLTLFPGPVASAVVILG